MKKMQWFRMYNDFLNDPKIITIAFEDQRHFIGVLALKSDGVLDQDCDPSVLNRIVAQKLWLDFSTINDVKNRLINAGLIDDEWQPVAWDKRQFRSDHDLTGAERQKRHRDRKKQTDNQSVNNDNALRNATVTPPDTDTDTDTDTDNKKPYVKKPRFKKPSLQEAREFIRENNFTFSAEEFIDSNDQKGWVVGKNQTPMKDWKAAMRTWQRNRQAGVNNNGPSSNQAVPKQPTSAAARVSQRNQRAYQEAIAREQGDPTLYEVSGEIYAQVDFSD